MAAPVVLAALALAIALVPAARVAAAPAGPVAPAVAPPPVLVHALAVEGLRRVDEAVILDRLRTRVGDVFDPVQLTADVRAVFALGVLADVRVRVEDFEGGVAVTFLVEERPYIRDLALAGNRRLESARLRAALGLELGGLLNPGEVQRALERLQAAYEDAGHLEARIAWRAEPFADGDVRLVFDIHEGRRFVIDRVRIEGNQALHDRQIRRALATRERVLLLRRSVVRRADVEADAERIVALYADHGHIQARVDAHEITVDRQRGRVTVTFRVTEGSRFHVGEVDVTGITLFPDAEVRRQLTLGPGDVFSAGEVRASVARIVDLYGAIGRACADVRPVTTPEATSRTIALRMEVHEGSEVHVERVDIRGNAWTRDRVIRREIGLAEGDLYTPRKLAEAQRRLVNLRYFERVELSTTLDCRG